MEVRLLVGKRENKSGPSVSKVCLADQIEDDTTARTKNRQKQRLRKEDNKEFVDADLSRKILVQARQQQLELEDEEAESAPSKKKPTIKLGPARSDGSDDEEEEEEINDNFEPAEDDYKYYGPIELDPEDERGLQMFQPIVTRSTQSLGDKIKEALEIQKEISNKIFEKRTEIATQCSEAGDMKVATDIEPKVQAIYESVGDTLSKYRSGKLPIAFEMIPTLKNWEQLLYVTEPQNWSAASMYQATRIFASNLNTRIAQRFYNLILLPLIRDDLEEYKRLNFHLYQALKKSLFKPRAFNEGILLPLLQSGTCTLREAVIIGSVVAKNSIPCNEASAAMLKIAEMPYSGANSIFLRILFDKKYALPYQVVDGVVYHFLRFERETRELPVLWHQAFLTFVQRYKGNISTEQKEALLELLKRQSHPVITPEIRRELQHAKCHGVEYVDPMNID